MAHSRRVLSNLNAVRRDGSATVDIAYLAELFMLPRHLAITW